MKAISLWQCWASAVALGLKRFETRHWTTGYRGPIAIHAAKKETRDLRKHFDLLMCRGDFEFPFRSNRLYSFSMLPKGAIVATAELTEIIPTEAAIHCGLIGDLEAKLGDYTDGRFAWRLENIKPLKQPYFIAGHQGFFEVPDKLE